MRVGDLPPVVRKDLKEIYPESEEEIKAYHHFASDHEELMSKSLFSAGTTWPSITTARRCGRFRTSLLFSSTWRWHTAPWAVVPLARTGPARLAIKAVAEAH